MILQTDTYLRPMIQKYGCYFMSLLFLINKYTGKTFGRNVINNFYEFAILNNWMDKDCFIRKPIDILRHLGYNRTQIKVEGPEYVCRPGEVEILCFERTYMKDGKPKVYTHFTCGSGGGVVTYDPMGVSNAVKYGKLKSKRVFS